MGKFKIEHCGYPLDCTIGTLNWNNKFNKPNIKRLRRVIYSSKCYQKKYKIHSYPYEIIFHTNDRLYVLYNGDVGIGLSAPAYKLNVNGILRKDTRS